MIFLNSSLSSADSFLLAAFANPTLLGFFLSSYRYAMLSGVGAGKNLLDRLDVEPARLLVVKRLLLFLSNLLLLAVV